MNLTKAARWMRLGAERGHVEAQYDLGQMYAEGHGLTQDDVLAYKWLDLAATRSSDSKLRDAAIKARELVASGISPAEKTEAQALAKAWEPNDDKLFIVPAQ